MAGGAQGVGFTPNPNPVRGGTTGLPWQTGSIMSWSDPSHPLHHLWRQAQTAQQPAAGIPPPPPPPAFPAAPAAPPLPAPGGLPAPVGLPTGAPGAGAPAPPPSPSALAGTAPGIPTPAGVTGLEPGPTPGPSPIPPLMGLQAAFNPFSPGLDVAPQQFLTPGGGTPEEEEEERRRRARGLAGRVSPFVPAPMF